MPTSPISPPMLMVTPSACSSRISRVNDAVLSALTCCCSVTVGSDRSTSVDESMSMLQKPAAIASRVRSRRPSISAAGSVDHFVALNWKWSPCRKTGPGQRSRMAAARMTAAYSAGRWSVYAISLLAISKMSVPASRSRAAAKAWRAVRYVAARTLTAGTVNWVGSNSSRPRARYSSWIEADPQPSAWLADQMTQRQASRSAASSLKTDAKASSSISSSRSRVSSSISRWSAVMRAIPDRRARRSSAELSVMNRSPDRANASGGPRAA